MRSLIALAVAATLAGVACTGSEESVGTDPATTVVDAIESAPTSDAAEAEAVTTATTVADAPATDDPAPSGDTAASTEGASGSDTDADEQTVTEDDLAVFVAAAERVLDGTSAEGFVLSDPDIYIAIGTAACAQFSGGDDFDAIASELLETLGTAGTDDAVLVGAIVGAATETICPEHADQI